MSDTQTDLIRLMGWLSDQFGRLHHGIGQLQAGQAENRRATLMVRQELTERMDRDQKGHRSDRIRGWMAMLPLRIVLLLAIAGALLLTGHLTVGELKTLLRITASSP